MGNSDIAHYCMERIVLTVKPIPALKDNYIWVIQQGKEVIIVDPSEAKPVLECLSHQQLTPIAILLTHNHHDHTDGVASIVEQYRDLPVFGPEETKAFANKLVQAGMQLELFGLPVQVIESAGHTAGHVSYLLDNAYLFCGDALFSGGCGRVFTGNYRAQFEALARFKQLPDFVQVYPAHEYTQSNLKFAQSVMPQSCVLMEYQERADILRASFRPTLPTTIGVEKQINPFMQAVSLDEFIALRQKKDNF